jgi:hypothetical protein
LACAQLRGSGDKRMGRACGNYLHVRCYELRCGGEVVGEVWDQEDGGVG